MIEAEIAVIGAGPAGATAALNLAPTRRVVMIERRPDIPRRIGESLVPAARRLLTDMGLWPSFEAEPHRPCYGNRAVWGSDHPVETDFLRDPDGHGWHLDRARFDAWLRIAAIRRGAQLLAPARLAGLARSGETWRVTLETTAGRVEVTARVLIDAGGRTAPLARQLGAKRRKHDRLVCGWIHGRGGGDGLTFVQAVEDGWWYTAPLPQQRRVLAFHTDADLPAADIARDRDAIMRHAASVRHLASLLSAAHFVPDARAGFVAAHSAQLVPCSGEGWLATGDAAVSFDPLSSQGLFNALYTGLAAAEAADRHLSGAADALTDYGGAIADIWNGYLAQLAHWYGAEPRWADRPFWRRRLGMRAVA